MTSASLNQMEASRPPAIVRPAEVKNCAFYESKLRECEGQYDKWLDEFKTSGAWKEKYKTWDACCELNFEVTQRTIDKRIQKYRTRTSVPSEPNRSDKKELAALNQVEQARKEPPPKNADEWEEKEHYDYEKPHIKTATEVLAENRQTQSVRSSENGKPKFALSIWRELEESLLGRALNRTDELNRQCPNARFHALLITQEKACMETLRQWRASVK